MTRVAAAIATAAAAPAVSSGLLQRKCACAEQGAHCEECGTDKLQRKAVGGFNPRHVPAIVNSVLRAPGQPLQEPTRAFMEERFAHSFGNVRIHVDAEAARSARAVGAAAYTVGRNVIFDHGRYAPDTANGRRLLAHELTHVVQQRGATAGSAGGLRIDSPHSAGEMEAERISAAIDSDHSPATAARQPRPTLHRAAEIVSRRSAGAPDALPLTLNLAKTPRTGLQFWPSDVQDTVVGPVTLRGGLVNGDASRLNVIIGENLSLHTLALELLPLWTTATPSTPAGAATPLPLPPLTADQLARALLVYNRTYLQVPEAKPLAMTKWRAGLRLPLPAAFDDATRTATVSPQQIVELAGSFDAEWAGLLQQRATANAAPSPALVMLEVDAFLRDHTDATERGFALGARALTNATAELPFIRQAFRQLGAAGPEVARAFLNNFGAHDFGVLGAQRDGNAILKEFDTQLNSKSIHLTDDEDAKQLSLSVAMGNPAAAPPGAARDHSEVTVPVDLVKLDGSIHDPSAELDVANAIYAQCNVRLVPKVNKVADADVTTSWIGEDRVIRLSRNCNSPSLESQRMIKGANLLFGLSSRFRIFFVKETSTRQRGETCPAESLRLLRGVSWVANTGNGRTLAHELGHSLLRSGQHPGTTQVMSPTDPKPPQGETFTDAECTRLHNNLKTP
jgi:hypothetical protein